jgi:hypothetical protein
LLDSAYPFRYVFRAVSNDNGVGKPMTPLLGINVLSLAINVPGPVAAARLTTFSAPVFATRTAAVRSVGELQAGD